MAKAGVDLESRVLTTLASTGRIPNSQAFADDASVDHEKVVGTLKSLETAECVSMTAIKEEGIALTPDGESYLAHGSPEFQVFSAVPAGDAGISRNDLAAALPKAVYGPGWGKCMKNRWLSVDKATGVVTRLVSFAPLSTRVAQLSLGAMCWCVAWAGRR